MVYFIIKLSILYLLILKKKKKDIKYYILSIYNILYFNILRYNNKLYKNNISYKDYSVYMSIFLYVQSWDWISFQVLLNKDFKVLDLFGDTIS